MAIEAKRGCGYRKVGGLYLVGSGMGVPCDRLPFALTVCPCCNAGIKPSLGWTWIKPELFFQGPHLTGAEPDGFESCSCKYCWLCHNPAQFEKAGLLWIGERFYKSPEHFLLEGRTQGFSRRIKAVPRGFKIGETPIFLAHKKVFFAKGPGEEKPGIFYAWIPQAIEQIFKESDRGTTSVKDAETRGIRAVFVPDNDKDHQGTVYDKDKENEKDIE